MDEDWKLFLEFKKKLELWIELIMALGNMGAAIMLLIVLLKVLWRYMAV